MKDCDSIKKIVYSLCENGHVAWRAVCGELLQKRRLVIELFESTYVVDAKMPT
jgi:hypothetical protein